MTPRDRFRTALDGGRSPGIVPTFELVFYLTQELLGKVHPSHRGFQQWGQMSRREQWLQIDDAARVYIDTALHYEHSAVFVHNVWGMDDSLVQIARRIRELSGDQFFLMCHGDATIGSGR